MIECKEYIELIIFNFTRFTVETTCLRIIIFILTQVDFQRNKIEVFFDDEDKTAKHLNFFVDKYQKS
jgi:hypothetical protein